MDQDTDPGDARAPALPRRTTPTWEVELLISGIAVFAMLQLPGVLDDAVFALRPRFSLAWSWPVTSFYLYAKTAAVILAATFILHLMLRARWIALVGLLSVHPGGIRWDQLRLGRIALEVERARVGESEDILERADNLATVVFASGVTIAVLLLVVSAAAVLGLGLAALVGANPDPDAMMLVFAAVLVPFFAAQTLDRQAPAFLDRHPRWQAGLRGLFRVYARFGIGSAQSPALALLTSNAGRRRVTLMTMAIMFVSVAAVAWSYIVMREPGHALGSYALFPEVDAASAGAVVASHYDDQRDPSRDPPDPYIPSSVPRPPYLRLVVPFVPIRDEPAVRTRCPAAAAATEQPEATRNPVLLACLRRLYPVSLDGTPLAVHYEAGSDPRTDRPALVAMLDIRELARGRHELVVGVPPKLDPEGEAPPGPGLHRIAFWR